MFQTDIRVAIAYSSFDTHLIAYDVKQRLEAFAKEGYPVAVSFIDESFERIEQDYDTKEHDKNMKISDKMKSYFTNCDYAIFLFDKSGTFTPDMNQCNPEANEQLESEVNVISYNIMYEYGLAKSVRKGKNESLPLILFQKNNVIVNEKINGNSAYKIEETVNCFEKECSDEGIESAAKVVVKRLINTISKNERRFVLPKDLNFLDTYDDYIEKQEFNDKLIRDTNVNAYTYRLNSNYDLGIVRPLKNDTYWADLAILSNIDYYNVVEDKLPRILEKFIIEYESFDNNVEEDDINISVIERKLMYIADRIVLLMYLNKSIKDIDSIKLYIPSKNSDIEVKEGYWEEKIKELQKAINGLPANHPDRKYIVKVGDLLIAVLGYHAKAEGKDYAGSYDDIIDKIKPIYDIGMAANPMLYSLAADYLGLCYHKNAVEKLKTELGLERIWFTELNDFLEFKTKLENPEIQPLGFEFISNLREAISVFNSVIKLENKMQENDNKNWYIWRSYAMYNKARCEFILYCVGKFAQVGEMTEGNNWKKDLLESCSQRKADYEKAKRSNIARDITHNLEAEYYLAVYECKIYQCLINCVDENDKVNTDEDKVLIVSDFVKWTEQSLFLGDTISAYEKAKKYDVLEGKTQNIKDCKQHIKDLNEKLKGMKDQYEAIKRNVKKAKQKKFDESIAIINECIDNLQRCEKEETFECLIYVYKRMAEIKKIPEILRNGNEKEIEAIKENTKSICNCIKNIVVLLGSPEAGLIVDGLSLLKKVKEVF